MRILMVVPTPPYPPASGFKTRLYQFLRFLGRHHDVSVVTYATADEAGDVDGLKSMCAAVHVVPRQSTTAGKRLTQLTAMLSSTSFQQRSQYSRSMQQRLTELCSGEPYDVLHIETSLLAGFEFDRRSIISVTEHDIVYELLHRMYETERSIVRRAYNWTEFRKFKAHEIDTWRRVDAMIVASEREEQIVRQAAPETPVMTAPNGVDVDYFRFSTADVDRDAIVMTGFMSTRPNIDGAVYFVEKILPHILRVRPNAVFYIVGGGPPEEVARLAGPHVVVTGTVPDVRPYVEKAAVFVVPLRMGGGTRLKILEALAMKKPLVSTSLGAEGIDVRHREHLLIADDPEAFAGGVLELLDNPRLASSLAEKGHDVVTRQYRWESIVDSVEVFYQCLIDQKSGTVRR